MLCAKRRISREGFTLVELLIVIVVIGVLSAMMMLSSTEAVASAKATDIINNLHQWKRAAIAWYVDHLDEVDSTANQWNGHFARFADHVHAVDIMPYLNTSFKTSGFTANNKYTGTGTVQDSSGVIYFTKHHTDIPKVWLIGCEFPDNSSVREKLESRAKTIGLLTETGQVYKASTGNCVYIKVADFNN